MLSDAITSYSSSHSLWQRFVHETVRRDGFSSISELRVQLLEYAVESFEMQKFFEAALAYAASFDLDLDFEFEMDDVRLTSFIISWTNSRPISPRLGIVVLLQEGLYRQLPAAISNRSIILEIERQFELRCTSTDRAFLEAMKSHKAIS